MEGSFDVQAVLILTFANSKVYRLRPSWFVSLVVLSLSNIAVTSYGTCEAIMR